MSFLDLVRGRYSVRNFTNVPVEEEKLRAVFEAVRAAPSACNFQPWVFIIIRDEHSRFLFEKIYNRNWFLSAPVIVAACCDRSASWKRGDGKDFGDIDVAIALDHLTLAAAELGLGTCWIGNFDEKKARQVLRLPDHFDPVALTPLGYPGCVASEKKRKSLDEILFRDYFGACSGL